MSYEEELTNAYKQSKGGGGYRPIICPGKTCKLCSLIRPILNFRDRYDPAVVKIAMDMRAKFQHFSNICFDPDYSKVYLFCYGKQIMDDLVRYQLDPIASQDYGNFAHPEYGRIMLVEKVIGTNGRPQYSVSPRAQVHKVPRLGMKPHNLNILKELLNQGIEYYPQKRLDVTTTAVRFLGFGPDMTRFFRTIEMHWGISQSDFESIQNGTYNPFNVATAVEFENGEVKDPYDTGEEDIPMFEDGESTAEAYDVRMEAKTPSSGEKYQPPLDKEAHKAPAEVAKETEAKKESRPPCFASEFDPEDSECVACTTWNTSCKEEFLKRYGIE